mgnify:FL=1
MERISLLMKNRMKKIFLIIFTIFLIIIIGIVASINIFKENNITLDMQKLALDLINQSIFEDDLSEIDRDSIVKKYNFPNDKIKNIISYMGSGATAEEILLLEVFNREDTGEILNIIKEKLEERKQDFQNYLPKEVFKLENYYLKSVNNYIILCISNDEKQAEKIINKYI